VPNDEIQAFNHPWPDILPPSTKFPVSFGKNFMDKNNVPIQSTGKEILKIFSPEPHNHFDNRANIVFWPPVFQNPAT
jgi:hypothetical protein